MPVTASLPFFLVDAFVVEAKTRGAGDPSACPYAPLTGNPAAVVLIPPGTPLPLPYAALAAEFAQSETAFVEIGAGGSGGGGGGAPTHRLRWFTPSGVEVRMCGHATLAAAAALADRQMSDAPITFSTLSGPLTVTRIGGGGSGSGSGSGSVSGQDPLRRLTLTLPARYPDDGLPPYKDALRDALLAAADDNVRSRVVNYGFNAELGYLIVEIRITGAMLRAMPAPNPAALLAAAPGPPDAPGDGRIAGVIVLAYDDDEDDKEADNNNDADLPIAWRFFGPWIGIDEDTATGSAASVVTPSFAVTSGDRRALSVRQLSPRGGAMRARMHGKDYVTIEAAARVRVRGEMVI